MDKKIKILIIAVFLIGIGSYLYISANSHDTMIEVTSGSKLKNGDFFTVLLKDNYRNVYPNEVINVKILDDSGWAHYFNATTDETGKASVLLEGMENGNYTVHANFTGTLFLHKSRSVSSLEINDGMN
ncbi:hypothetical protein [Methanobrevibacter sp.]|uniref:hypothetical protein n=1 Tax=Methanobrevibacter sp. TaxID=66852 RepID=UPI00388ED6AF